MAWKPPPHTDYPWQDSPSEETPLDSQNLADAESGIIGYVQQVASLLGVGAVPVQTSTYVAQPGDFVPVDASASSVAVTLPGAPADQTRIGVHVVAVAGGHTVTINCSGSDAFNLSGGSTSLALAILDQGVLLQYHAIAGVWYAQASNLSLSVLDGRYAPSGSSVSSVFGRSGAVTAHDSDYFGILAAARTGATADAVLAGGTTSGAPTSGTFTAGDVVVDHTGLIWVCTVSGTPGTWANAGASSGVSTFNTRTGVVTLTKADVTGTGLAPADIAAAPLASPGLTGNPTAPTQSAGNNTTRLATTQFVTAAVGASTFAPTIYRPVSIDGTALTGQSLLPNQLYVVQVALFLGATLTGIAINQGANGGTPGNVLMSLYNGSGTRVAASNSTALANSSAVQRIAFTSPYAAAPGAYFIGLQFSNNSVFTITQKSFAPCASIAQGSFAAPASITPPSSPANLQIPVMSTY